MKRSINEIDFSCVPYNNYFSTSRTTEIIKRRDAQIFQLEQEYMQLVKDIETFYQDQSQELCIQVLNYTTRRIKQVKYIANKAITEECEDLYRIKKLCL